MTTLVYRTPVPAQLQLDVIQFVECQRNPGGRLFSLELACYFRRCLRCFGETFCVILEPLRDADWEHTEGHYTVMHVYGVGTQKAIILQ